MAKPLHEPGVTVDGFRLEELIHQGGMAALWRVSRPGATMPLLMKVPRIGEGADPAAIVSFEMEQMIMPRLTGPHVPAFVAAGDFSAQPYIVMEAIAGETLLRRLDALPLPYDEVAALGGNIATALHDLHGQHVIHLDVKPSNIMLRPSGEAVMLDYGLARHDQLPDLMREEFRVPFGTAPYMSPEQLRGIRDDPRSDLFALGVLLYFFSTGERPFGEAESLGGMRRRLWRDPVPPRALRADYPPWLQEIVLRCLEVEPAWRHPTAAQLAFELGHPEKVKLTRRSERLRRDRLTTVLRRRFNTDLSPRAKPALAAHLSSAPIVVGGRRPRRRLGRFARRLARHRRPYAGDHADGAARLPQRAQIGAARHRQHARRNRPQQAHRAHGGAAALGGAAEARRVAAHRACARGR